MGNKTLMSVCLFVFLRLSSVLKEPGQGEDATAKKETDYYCLLLLTNCTYD